MRKLAQTSPSPKSLPGNVAPRLDSISPPAPISKDDPKELNSTSSLAPNDTTHPDQLLDSPLPSIFTPPLPPGLQTSPPPAATGSPPPPTTPDGPPPASTPPLVPGLPPPTQTPPPSSPPPPTDATLSPPPQSPPSPPPKDANLPPPTHSPPPSPAPPPRSSPPPPQVIPPPPSPAKSPPPPAKKVKSPPPSRAPPPKVSPPPPDSLSAPPPTVTVTPPPPVPWSHVPPPSSPPPPTTNTSVVGVPPSSHRPMFPKEKPTSRPTSDTGVPTSTSSNATGGGLSAGGSVAISIFVVFVVLGLIATAVFFIHKRKRRGAKMTLTLGYPAASPFGSPHNSGSYLLRPPASLKGTKSGSNFINSPSEQGGINNSRSWFTYEELAHATDWFSADNELGEGGFGKVYKGVLSDGREVAVKQLKAGGGQGEREFRAEVEIISRIHHRHLVSLVGYCISEQQRLLVYDYVANDTLHYHLHGVGRPVLEWSIRVKVAAGAARGLAYLHEDCNPRIIHRDIKSANILLDNNYEAKVADFGLAKLAMELDSQTHVSTRVMGTFGYMAPEYATTGKLTEKSDVYSFGVVLLELITGNRPVDDSGPLGDESLVEWARPRLVQALESEVFDPLVDPILERNYSASEMFRMVEAAAACVRHQATRRPKMSQVVRALDSIGEESNLSNGMKFGQSEVIDSAEHSAQIRRFQSMAFGSGSSQEYSSSYMSHSQGSWRT